MLRFLVPLGIFAALVAFLWVGLGKDPSLVPSPLIGKPAPAFGIPPRPDVRLWARAATPQRPCRPPVSTMRIAASTGRSTGVISLRGRYTV